MTATAAPNVAKWATEQATRDRDAFFDLAVAVLEDGLADDASAPEVVAECARNDYDLSLGFARQVITVAKEWGMTKLVENRNRFNSFRPVHTLVAQKGTLPGEKPTGTGDPVPVLDDGTIDTDAVYTRLAASGKPITHRDVLRAVGKANFDDKKVVADIDSADVFTVAATMPAEALADRIANDKVFRDALVDLVVGIESTPGPVTTALATATGGGGFDALAELKKAESIVRRLADTATIDTDVADVLRPNRAPFQVACDLLNLTLDGVAAAE